MIKIVVRQSIALMFSIVSMLAINSAHAKQTMCVFDLQGTSGDMFALMRDYAVAAQRWVQIFNYAPIRMNGLRPRILKQANVMLCSF